jgi:hypothetical protein
MVADVRDQRPITFARPKLHGRMLGPLVGVGTELGEPLIRAAHLPMPGKIPPVPSRPVPNDAEQAGIRIGQSGADRTDPPEGYSLLWLHSSHPSRCEIIDPPSRLGSDKLFRR